MGRALAIARAAVVEARGERRIEEQLAEAFAEHAQRDAQGEGVEGIVRGQALTLVITPALPAGLEGLLSPSGVLYVRRSNDAAHEKVVALHELAHHLLTGTDHTHADVWHVALALGAPRGMVRRARGDAAALAVVTGLPLWACELRIAMVSAGG